MCDLTQGCLHFYSQSFLHQGFLSLVVAFSYTGNILVEWSGLWSQSHQGWSLGSPHMSLSETPLTGDTVKLSSLGGYSVCNLHVEGFAFLFSLLTVNIINDSDVCLVMDTLNSTSYLVIRKRPYSSSKRPSRSVLLLQTLFICLLSLEVFLLLSHLASETWRQLDRISHVSSWVLDWRF